LQEINYVEALRLSVPVLVVVLILGIALYFIQKSRAEAEDSDKSDLDPEKLRLEMEALAKEKLAQRKSDDMMTYKTDSPPQASESHANPEPPVEDNTGGFIEGEPLA
jgi:hypothetical protein